VKKKWLLLLIFSVVLIFTLLPIGYLHANPGNLINNGDFSNGLNGWDYSTTGGGSTIGVSGQELLMHTVSNNWAIISQEIFTIQKNLTFSFDVFPNNYNGGGIYYCVQIFKNGSILSFCNYFDSSFPTGTWTNVSKNLSAWWKDFNGIDMQDYDEVKIWIEAGGGECDINFDNVRLETTAPPTAPAVAAPIVWVRPGPMVCRNVWVNDKGSFQFVFWYPYKDNNWVKIYDMGGEEVYSIDMPYDNPNIIVDLPNGNYTVKTFTAGSTEPIQTFVIGK
jgi:hypothetical protein